MTTPLTGATLTAERAQRRWSTYHIAISVPNVVFTARINHVFQSLDNQSQMEWDGGTGTYTNVKAGMSCRIGSAAGLSDIGIVRVRKDLGASTFYFGQVSGMLFADNQYLTFTDDAGLFAKLPTKTGDIEEMDTDLSFDGNSFALMVGAGPAGVTLELSGATVSYTPPYKGYSPIGATLASCVWTATGTSATSGLTTTTPVFTWNAVGEYYIRGTFTDSVGAVTNISRKVFVRLASDAAVSIKEITGDIDSGGFTARIEGYTGVGISALQDRALCVIWRKDYSGTARAASYGPYAGATATRFVGWLNGQSLTIDPDTGSASFTIDGPAAWLDRIYGAPMYRQDTSSTATAWHHIPTMTTDKALYCLAKWYSTLADICDVTLTGDATRIYTANVNSGSLLSQINGLAGEKLKARICFDELGCGFVSVEPSLRTSAGKAANTVLFDIASSDLSEQLDIDRVTVAKSSQVEISGSTFDGTTELQIYSREPGNTPAQYGSPDAPTSTLAFASQAVCNQMAGDLRADANREYRSVSAKLYWANDYAGWAMAHGYIVRMSMAATATPRGITWTSKRFFILSVGLEYDAKTGAESTALELAEETTGNPGIYYIPPTVSDEAGNYDNPPFDSPPAIVPPGTDWFPEVEPPVIPGTGACPSDAGANLFKITFSPSTLTGAGGVLSSKSFCPCQLRPATFTNGPTVLELELGLEGDMTYTPTMSDRLAVYAIDALGNHVFTGSIDSTAAPDVCAGCYIFVTFAPIAPMDVAGFEIVLTAGGGYAYTSGSVIATGTVAANDATGDVVTLVPGSYYSVEDDRSIWNSGIGPRQGVRIRDESSLYNESGASFAIRNYYQATGATRHVTVNDNNYGDNTGSSGWILREASARGSRKIIIYSSILNNVCAVSA